VEVLTIVGLLAVFDISNKVGFSRISITDSEAQCLFYNSSAGLTQEAW
jgi:hypothetical protein